MDGGYTSRGSSVNPVNRYLGNKAWQARRPGTCRPARALIPTLTPDWDKNLSRPCYTEHYSILVCSYGTSNVRVLVLLKRCSFTKISIQDEVKPKKEHRNSVPRGSGPLQSKLSIRGSLGTCWALPSDSPIHRVISVLQVRLKNICHKVYFHDVQNSYKHIKHNLTPSGQCGKTQNAPFLSPQFSCPLHFHVNFPRAPHCPTRYWTYRWRMFRNHKLWIKSYIRCSRNYSRLHKQ